MRYKIVIILILIFAMFFIINSNSNKKISPTLMIGFMLLASYIIGDFFETLKLPKITGYIISGLLFGPYILKFYSVETVKGLSFLNSMALAFIAFNAGAELRKKDLIKNIRVITFLTIGVTVFVYLGVTLSIYFLSEIIPFMKFLPISAKIGVASIFGVISVARSPSSTIAIINETGAKGSYTNAILSSTIVTDVLIIILFAITISTGEILIKSSKSFNPQFIFYLVIEILLAFFIGFVLGHFILFLMNMVKVEFSILIIALGFFVIKFSHFLGNYIVETYEISLNLEPLLICMAAGFTVQNFSKQGEIFLKRMEKVSIPIFLTFFSITGASINLNTLAQGWFIGVIAFLSRILTIYAGSFISGKMAGAIESITKWGWMGFITQAGVSLGLLSEVLRRFPEFGTKIQTILIATITINQIVGPILLKYGLTLSKETRNERSVSKKS